MESKWKVREATIDDRDDVLSILPEGTYEGDYLPDKYASLLKDPNYYSYVCIWDGRVVAFSGVSIHDEGQTGIMRSGRVQKDFRGKGATRIILNLMRLKHPNLQYAVYFTSSNMQELLQKPSNSLITKVIGNVLSFQKYTFYQGNNTVLADVTTTAPNVSLITESILQDLFRNQTMYPKVFYCKHLIVDIIPFKPMDSNIELILKTGTGYISFQNEPMKTLVTFGSHFRLPSGEIFCNLIVHGTINECFNQHVLLHIALFREEIKNIFTLAIISMPSDNDRDLYKDVLVPLGLQRASTKNYNRKEAIIFQVKWTVYEIMNILF